MDQSTGLEQVFSEAGMQDKGGLQIGLTEGQESSPDSLLSSAQASWDQSS